MSFSLQQLSFFSFHYYINYIFLHFLYYNYYIFIITLHQLWCSFLQLQYLLQYSYIAYYFLHCNLQLHFYFYNSCIFFHSHGPMDYIALVWNHFSNRNKYCRINEGRSIIYQQLNIGYFINHYRNYSLVSCLTIILWLD